MVRITAATLAAFVALAPAAQAEGDAAAGERVFNKCKACHAVGADAKNKVGPQLNGIVGAPAGQVADFKYSDALLEQASAGLVWDEATLAEYLTKPREFIPGNKMSFAGLRKEADIANVIAYMATFE